MIALQIKSLKVFMNSLLASDTFDIFLLEEAIITTYNTFSIDGHQNKEFYTPEEWEDKTLRPYDFTCFKDIRNLCFDLIKGKHTPLSFKFVLHLTPEHVASILEHGESPISADQVKAFVLTIRYDGNDLTLITGTSFHTFIPSKEPEKLWDKALCRFLTKKELAYEEL